MGIARGQGTDRGAVGRRRKVIVSYALVAPVSYNTPTVSDPTRTRSEYPAHSPDRVTAFTKLPPASTLRQTAMPCRTVGTEGAENSNGAPAPGSWRTLPSTTGTSSRVCCTS